MALIIAADQLLKVWVKTSFYLGEERSVFGDWFLLYFTENPGFAFGIELGGSIGKLFLTVFRLVALVFIGGYIFQLLKKTVSLTYILCVSLVFAGALGNIIDSVLYGVLFSDINSYDGGLLYGHVVDMLYFPVIQTILPEWLPFWGGQSFTFFRPIFNIADSSISIGVFSILLFHRHHLKEGLEKYDKKKVESAAVDEQPDQESERAANPEVTPGA